MDRRAFLTALATLPFARSAIAETRVGRLDLHHHFASPLWIQKVLASGRQSRETLTRISPARALEDIDKAGVSTAFMSCTMPGVAVTDDFASERTEAIALA